jgi:hypothetical protein
MLGNTKHKKICFCLWQNIIRYFFLDEKVSKKSRKNDASALEAIHLARRSFIPPHGYSASLGVYFI